MVKDAVADTEGGGVKADTGKPMMSLLPMEALIEEAKVLTFGAQKYDAHNWRGGMKFSRLADAALRHLLAWIGGEDNDPETGLSHLAHLRCCTGFLIAYQATGTGTDDRYKHPDMDTDSRAFTTVEVLHTCPCGAGEKPCPGPDGLPLCMPKEPAPVEPPDRTMASIRAGITAAANRLAAAITPAELEPPPTASPAPAIAPLAPFGALLLKPFEAREGDFIAFSYKGELVHRIIRDIAKTQSAVTYIVREDNNIANVTLRIPDSRAKAVYRYTEHGIEAGE